MRKASHAAARALRDIDRDFPARPTLPVSMACAGLAFIGRGAETPTALAPLRERLESLRRGTLGTGADASPLLLATFTSPLRMDETAWPSALRLAPSSPSNLASHGQLATPADDRPAGGWRTLDLWWAGKQHRIALDALEPVSLATLWELPRLHIHAAQAPEHRPHGAAADETAEPSTALTPVTRAGPPVATSGASELRQMDEALRAEAGLRRREGGGKGWFAWLFRTRAAGQSGAGAGRPGPWGPARPRPAPLDRLMGWLRWHTPLGNALRRQFGDRLRQVERMIASGDMDAALRLALRLGGGRRQARPPTRYPNQLPGMRARLDFEIDDDSFAAPILAEGDFFQLQSRYRALADQLEAKGDFRRSAYIHSQLLGDHARAVHILEKGDMLAEAIKLAIQSRQDPVLIIRLLYTNGQLDEALAFARRTACFDQLAEDSRQRDPAYHAYVVEAWTQHLLESRQAFRALQVTDHITGIADLAAARRTWLDLALGEAGPDCFGGELAVRMLLTAHWSREDLHAGSLADFPAMRVAGQNGATFAVALDWVQQVLWGEAERSREAVIGMLAALSRLADPQRDEQAAFWSGPSVTVLEAFARAVVEQAADHLDRADLGALHALLQKARLPVLAADMQKLRKLEAPKLKPDRDWIVPPVATIRPPVVRGCFLANDTMLVWRENGLLQLIDRHGALRWQQSVGAISALVTIGTSTDVIVVQAERDGASRLTRFATHSRTFHPIGTVKLNAHHDITSESQWLVQIAGEIGALDLARLCARTPAIEFAWSCALTDRLAAIAFAHEPGGSSWLTRDLSPERFGIVESWTLRRSGDLVTRICLPSAPKENEALMAAPATWSWMSAQGNLVTMQEGVGNWLQMLPWNDRDEERARIFSARRRMAGQEDDIFQPCDLARPFVTASSGPSGTEIFVGRPGPQQMGTTLLSSEDMGMMLLARSPPGPSMQKVSDRSSLGLAMLADRFGRLFIVDGAAARIDVL